MSDYVPTIGIPLAFVVAVGMLRDFCEDYRRKAADNNENDQPVYLGVPSKKKF